jgi:hypothetical protein
MTILAALAVNPGNGEKPYVLIAADSKAVTTDVIFDKEKGMLIEGKPETEEDAKKVFKPLPNLIIGISGTIPYTFEMVLVDFIKNNISTDSELDKASRIIYEWIVAVLKPEKYPKHSVEIIIGGYLNSVPALSFFGIGHGKTDTEIKYRIAQPGQIFPVLPTLGEDIDNKLRDKLRERIGLNPLSNITAVRRALTQFVVEAAAERPETCNDVVTVERLK